MGEKWDEEKRKINLERHGIDFPDAEPLFDSVYATLSAKPRETEERFRAVGVVEDRIITVVWTPRNGIRRFISVRPASKKERSAYYEITRNKA
jgi:uncharacterized DUF497 family protein